MKILFAIVVAAMLVGCGGADDNNGGGGPKPGIVKPPQSRDDVEGLLTYIQKTHFEYMWSAARPNSGLARVRYHQSAPSQDENTLTMGAGGFGIMGLLVGIERGFITRTQGVDRLDKIVTFLERADRWHGMYSHWIDDKTGKTIPFAGSNGEDDGADIVETSFLTAGLICTREYLKNGSTREKGIAARIDAIWRAMEWNFFKSTTDDCLLWHWSPTVGFKKNFHLEGYNEALLTYILAAASPTHKLSDPKAAYRNGWSRGGSIVNTASRYDVPFVVKHNTGANDVGAMFWVAFSYAGFNPSSLKDENGINYFKACQSQAMIQYKYCVANPKGWRSYGANCWGMSAGYTSNNSSDYQAMNTKNDVGVITTNAALIAMPFTPTQSIEAAKHYYWDIPTQMGPWGFWDSYSDTEGTVKKYLANNQCPVAPMIENYRTGLLWKLFMGAPEIAPALTALGFTADTN